MPANLPSLEKALLLDLFLSLPLKEDTHVEGKPLTNLLLADHLIALREALRRSELRNYAELYHEECAKVEALNEVYVGDKVASPPSGTRNDYWSRPKYDWSSDDPEIKGRRSVRDGVVNPRSYDEKYDYLRLVEFSESTFFLALADFVLDRQSAGAKAAAWIENWFLDEEKRQNPNFKYAQFEEIAGRSRWQGVIESRYLIYVIEAIQLLSFKGWFGREKLAALKKWFSDLIDWLQVSGVVEAARKSNGNISIWLDAQLLSFATFAERNDVITAEDDIWSRIAMQFDSNGLPVKELARANPADYVAFSYLGLVFLNGVARKYGRGIWDARQGDGKQLRATAAWLSRLIDSADLMAEVVSAGGRLAEERELPRISRILALPGMIARHGKEEKMVTGAHGRTGDAEKSAVSLHESRELHAELLAERVSFLTLKNLHMERDLDEALLRESSHVKRIEEAEREVRRLRQDLEAKDKASKYIERKLQEEQRRNELKEKEHRRQTRKLRSANEIAKKRIRTIHNSLSWKITKPLRFVSAVLSKLGWR